MVNLRHDSGEPLAPDGACRACAVARDQLQGGGAPNAEHAAAAEDYAV